MLTPIGNNVNGKGKKNRQTSKIENLQKLKKGPEIWWIATFL